MSSKYYAGIGSRETPADVLQLMEKISYSLSNKGFTLRSGGAKGADQCFQYGARRADIFLPWPSFELECQEKFPKHNYLIVPKEDHDAERSVDDFHPKPSGLTDGGRSLMRRNYRQVIGEKRVDDSLFVICWTPHGAGGGGTGQAIRIAKCMEIPVIDLGNRETYKIINSLI
jgi:hypothetical protein